MSQHQASYTGCFSECDRTTHKLVTSDHRACSSQGIGILHLFSKTQSRH